MISNPFLLMSIMVSALIAFATVVVLSESSLVLLKVKNARVRSTFRLLPFISLFFDLLLNSFSIGYWLNPLNCSSCVQKLLLTVYFPDLKSYLYSNGISLSTYLGLNISQNVSSAIFILFLIVTTFFTGRVVAAIIVSVRSLKAKSNEQELYLNPIANKLLAKAIKEKGIKIYVGNNLVPMAAYFKAIFLPKEIIETLPQDEIEAVIAHEIEHISWKDPIVRMFVLLVSAIFWWVPTGHSLKKLEFEQEVACDQSILKYGMNEEFLASAIVKVAMKAKEKRPLAYCSLSTEKHSALRRVQMMLGQASAHAKRHEWISYGIVLLAATIGLVCILWL